MRFPSSDLVNEVRYNLNWVCVGETMQTPHDFIPVPTLAFGRYTVIGQVPREGAQSKVEPVGVAIQGVQFLRTFRLAGLVPAAPDQGFRL
jgi:hypothetical protein